MTRLRQQGRSMVLNIDVDVTSQVKSTWQHYHCNNHHTIIMLKLQNLIEDHMGKSSLISLPEVKSIIQL